MEEEESDESDDEKEEEEEEEEEYNQYEKGEDGRGRRKRRQLGGKVGEEIRCGKRKNVMMRNKEAKERKNTKK